MTKKNLYCEQDHLALMMELLGMMPRKVRRFISYYYTDVRVYLYKAFASKL